MEAHRLGGVAKASEQRGGGGRRGGAWSGEGGRRGGGRVGKVGGAMERADGAIAIGEIFGSCVRLDV